MICVNQKKEFNVLNNIMLAIAMMLLHEDQIDFNPNNYCLEYRKNKNDKDIIKLLNLINKKCNDEESKITILLFGLNNIFKKKMVI